MPRHHRSARSIAAVAALVLPGLAVVADAAPAAARSRTTFVRPGESIQAAIDSAEPSSTIVVVGGVHAEQLTISTDGITLLGIHTRLVPPATPVTNTCSRLAGPKPDLNPPSQAGICVTGHDIVLAPFEGEHSKVLSVGTPVRSVRVEGFDIAGFSGPYVAVVGGRDVRVAGNRLTDPSTYGVLSAASRSTRVTRNTILGPSVLGFIGTCVDDVASPMVDGNDVSGQVIGFCVQTTGATITRNEIHANCVGVYVDPRISATVTLNHVADNNGCDALPPTYGRGVTVAGAHGTVVSYNVFEGHTGPGGLAAVSVMDGEEGTVATGNVVTHNLFRGNTLDLSATATGVNRITHNACDTSVPPGLCD